MEQFNNQNSYNANIAEGLNDFGGQTNEMLYNLEAEQTVLGALIIEPDVLPIVLDYLKPDAFYRRQHRELFSIIIRMFGNGQQADIITIMNEAVSMGVFETSAMAKTYLKGITESVPSISNIESYCKILEEKYYLRALLTATKEINEAVYDGSTDVRTLIDSAEQKIFDIRQGRQTGGLVKIDEVVLQAYDRLQKITGIDKEKYIGSKSGFVHLDAVTSGLNDSDLIILAARPGMGKTSFVMNIVTNLARSTDKSVVIFSLEMSSEQLATRMLSSEALVNSHSLRTGLLMNSDWDKLAQGAASLSRMNIYLDDTAGMTVQQMKAKLRRVKNLGLVVIDYLQLMESAKKSTNRVQEVSEMTRQLKLMAKELKVPVITLSQLNRGAEGRTNHRPMLSDLRESGSIEQDADIILFLYRESYYEKETEDQNISECIVAKNRHGETTTVKLVWNGEFTLFRNFDENRVE